MDPVHMRERCPGATRLGLATVPDYGFGIAAGGFGMIRPVPGSIVRGVLWRLEPADEASLDEFERVAIGFYKKGVLPVVTETGRTIDAMFYAPSDDRPGTPAPGYLERILEVGRELGFPEEYLQEIAAHLHASDRE
jgi:hypothetical protein